MTTQDDIHTRWNNLEGTPDERELALRREGWDAGDISMMRAEMEGDQAARQMTITDEQIHNACMSYRHDFGLMTGSQQDLLMYECREWARAIFKALERPTDHPQ